jgi:hypothetical protein
VKKFLGVLRAVVAALIAVYVGDLAVARARGDAAFGTTRLNVLYATPLKASKVDYTSGGAQDVECVRSLFPHFGDAPCWYAARQKTKRVDL